MPASNYVKQGSLNFWLKSASVTQPSTLHVGLFTGDPGAGNLAGNEISGNGYARAALTVGNVSIVGDYAQVANNAVVQFAAATGSGGTPTFFGVFDAQTSGNLLFYGALPTTFAVTAGMEPKFNIGDLKISAQ